MAATKLIAMHQNKGRSVMRCLKDRTDYAMNGEKTDEGKYISSYQCNPELVDLEFAQAKKEYLHKTWRQPKGDVIAYQIRQSFKPGEITPEEANEVGYETGMRFTKGKKQGVAPITLADGPAGLRLMKFYDVEKETGKIAQKPFHFSLEGGVFYEDTGVQPGEERYYQYCTAIPVGTLLAQSFDTELVQEVGEMIGQELQEFRVTLWLAPGMNIHRNPLCGRNFEYYSEDPLLTGLMAAAMTRGVQSNAGVGTTIKHFACNSQEDNRMGCDSILSERALREIYLKGFEIAVKTAQPMSIMTSYNKVNGIHAANSFDLCTKAARDEWGFQGVIMTDWTTTENGPDCTAAGCMRAGNDLVMPGCQRDHENLRQELEKGMLSLDDLKACVSHSIHIILQSLAYEETQPYGKLMEK